jgi:NADH-quinone oxidoreductase subunit A
MRNTRRGGSEDPFFERTEGVLVLEQYFGDYITVAVFLAAGALLVGVGILVAGWIRPNNPNPTKSEIYECGIEPTGDGWNQTHIRYYIFALLFLIFDVEAVFIFPWALKVETFANADLGGYILIEMFAFIAILLLGLVYAIRKGVLKWE